MTKIHWDDPDPLFINPKFGIDLQGHASEGIPIPTYGNYGGPNIYDRSGTGETVDALDALFKTHDETIQSAMSDSQTSGVLAPDELVAAHAQLFDGILHTLPQSGGFVLNDAEATLYAGFTLFGLTAELAQLGLLEKLELALADLGDPEAPFDFFNPALEDVSAALNYAQDYMETGFAGLTPEEAGEARSLAGLLPMFEHQFQDFLIV